MNITPGYLAMPALAIEKKLVADVARPIGQIVVKICQVKSLEDRVPKVVSEPESHNHGIIVSSRCESRVSPAEISTLEHVGPYSLLLR
jgi:hypothetical protein